MEPNLSSCFEIVNYEEIWTQRSAYSQMELVLEKCMLKIIFLQSMPMKKRKNSAIEILYWTTKVDRARVDS